MNAAERFVSIGERRLHARVVGNGPAILLSAGSGMAGVGAWEPVESALAAFATVVSYDRAGLGNSDVSAVLPTASNMATDLRQLIDALRLAGKIVLVGRSLGALPVQLFACRHPGLVAGMVLLDPTPDVLFAAGGSRLALDERARSERDCMAQSCAEVRDAIETRHLLPDVPLTIVSAAIRDAGEASTIAADYLLLAHRHMAQRAPRGRLVVAGESSHANLLRTQPDVVIEAIRDVVLMA
jgi:pimeloyl-ACP methyl ester carboxylesterase